MSHHSKHRINRILRFTQTTQSNLVVIKIVTSFSARETYSLFYKWPSILPLVRSLWYKHNTHKQWILHQVYRPGRQKCELWSNSLKPLNLCDPEKKLTQIFHFHENEWTNKFSKDFDICLTNRKSKTAKKNLTLSLLFQYLVRYKT